MDPERDFRLDTRLANFNERIPKVLGSVDKVIAEYSSADDYEKMLIEELKKNRTELEEIYVRFNQARPTSDPIKIVPFYDSKADDVEKAITRKEEQLEKHREKKWHGVKSNMTTAVYVMLAIFVVYMIGRFGRSEPMQKLGPDQPTWATPDNIMYLQQKERLSVDPGRYHPGHHMFPLYISDR